ncbi:putative Tat binding protein 1(TBP-1)-interacting protein [Cryptosporidium felis]|nr:putative Tat binding protein 1(TBP-1)-interacting protein [Cryptosporidium felis]
MVKRSKEESGVGEDLSNSEELDEKVEADTQSKPVQRPSRSSRKTVKYSEYDDEDDFDDDFESDFEDELESMNENENGGTDEDEDNDDGDDDNDDLDLEDEEFEKGNKAKKGTKKGPESNNVKSKPKKLQKENGNIMDSDDSDDDEKKSKSTKKKKLTAPKNLTKRSVANTSESINEAIYNYMKEQNRPYSIQNVVDNLHNAYSKKQVTDEMDRLTTEGKFLCKEYGKQKVYLVDQSDCKELNKEEMEILDKNILSSEAELNDLEARIKLLKQETRNITVPLPIDVLEEKISQEQAKEEILRKEKLLDEDCEIIPVEKLKELKNELQKKQTKLKRLKSACKSVIDTFSESMERKVSLLLDWQSN